MGGNKVYLAKYKTTKAWFPLNKIKYIYKTITLTGGWVWRCRRGSICAKPTEKGALGRGDPK